MSRRKERSKTLFSGGIRKSQSLCVLPAGASIGGITIRAAPLEASETALDEGRGHSRKLRALSIASESSDAASSVSSDSSLHYITKTMKNNDVFEGYVHKTTNKREGFGLYIFSNGDKYQGFWKDGLFHDNGWFKWSNGDYYVGQFHMGKMTGEGIKNNTEEGSSIKGCFLNAKAHGFCTKQHSNSDSYEGYYEDDKRQGYGEYVWTAACQRYCGAWKCDEMHGVGMKVSTLEVASEADRMRLSLLSGHDDTLIYRGDFRRNSRHGQGLAVGWDGSRYAGEMAHDLRHGWGSYTSDDGLHSYDGEFSRGHRSGFGTLHFESALEEAPPLHQWSIASQRVEKLLALYGGFYSGDFAGGQVHGRGVLRLNNGHTLVGEFSRGVLVSQL